MKKIKISDIKSVAVVLAVVILIVGVFASFGGASSGGSAAEETEYLAHNIGLELPMTNGRISFLGDSITTYEGISNTATTGLDAVAGSVYYNSDKISMYDTYWYKSAKALGYSLLVNNSCNAGRVTDTHDTMPSAVDRASKLHESYAKPDVIVVYMGTNDLAHEVALDDFETSYTDMLAVIKTNYPNANVYCCTLLPESRTADINYLRLDFNEVIREATENAGYTVIDFAEEIPSWNYTEYTIDDGSLRVHPNENGMDKLASVVISTIKNNR